MAEFDYTKAMAELDDISKYIKRSEELIGSCRAYLRTAREQVETLGK